MSTDASLSRAAIELSGQPGDALAFNGSLAGTGVDLTTSTATNLVFEGAGTDRDLLQILQSVVLEPAPVAGVRQIELTVVDERGRRERYFRAQRRSERDGRHDGHHGRRPARSASRWSTDEIVRS